jgi:hypothetical protein
VAGGREGLRVRRRLAIAAAVATGMLVAFLSLVVALVRGD